MVQDEAGISGIREIGARMVAATPQDSANFFGFYDLCPFSPDGRDLLLLNCPADWVTLPVGEPALVRRWRPEDATFETLGETRGWNWQHGARQQWLRDGSILYNDVDGQGHAVARHVSPDGTPIRTLDMAIGALSPDESIGVGGNYARLARLDPTYGYGAAVDRHLGEGPTQDGLWSVSMADGAVSLLLSYAQLAEIVGSPHSDRRFVTHPVFSPDGTRLAFFVTDAGEGGTTYARLLVRDCASGKVRVVAQERVSHPAWIGEDRIWYWGRNSGAVRALATNRLLANPAVRAVARFARRLLRARMNQLVAEGFYVSDLNDDTRKRVAEHTLSEDGHYSWHGHGSVLLGDTYPDEDAWLTLLLFDLASGQRVDLARIRHEVATREEPMRCDLHPRWDRSGTQVCIDFVTDGCRRTGIFDVGPALSRLATAGA